MANKSPATIKEVEVDTDWQRNWHASLAVKVTAPLLWIIVIVSIAFSIITQRNIEHELQMTFEQDADWVAYEVYSNIDSVAIEDSMKHLLSTRLADRFADTLFTGLRFDYLDLNVSYGTDCENLESVLRPVTLHLNDPVHGLMHTRATLTLCHFPIEQLAKKERKNALLYFGAPFLMLGFLLAGVIHLVVTRPIQDMVRITKQVASGDMNVRMDETRQDEFGDLARFSNQMVDSLNQKHGELRDAVHTANRASKAKSIFLANMSHELRTPLNAIIGYAEIIKEEAEVNRHDIYQKDSQRILKSARHLLELIDGILDLSKVEAGKMELVISDFSLSDLIRTVADLVMPMMEENGNQVECRIAENLKLMHSDEMKIRQILFNLFSNAAKFTRNGNVTVIVEQVDYDSDRDWINITVEDTGIGMTEEQQNVIFHDFTQADVSTTREYGGTGLGLSITQRFCVMLGGSITVVSHQGQGSSFFVELPRIYQPPEASADIVDS